MGRVRTVGRFVTRSCVLAAALWMLCGAAFAQEAPTFESDVSLVTLPVTVKDSRGAPIGDLNREDFAVLEEGEPREIAVFERRTNRPLSLVLMLDTSLSTAIELRYEVKSAERFLDALFASDVEASDVAAVYSFSSGVEAHAGFTRSLSKLQGGLRQIRPKTGTSVYDAIVLASRSLGTRQGRRVLLMITDGGDTTSGWQFNDALQAAHDHEIAIYPLIVLPIRADAGRNRGGEHALVTLAKNTGGESFVQHGAENLDEVFREVLRNLRTQYLLGFYPLDGGAAPSKSLRKIDVQANREGAVTLSRSAYFARRPEPQARRARPSTSTGSVVNVRRMPQRGDTVQEEPEDAEKEARPPDGRPRPPIVRGAPSF